MLHVLAMIVFILYECYLKSLSLLLATRSHGIQSYEFVTCCKVIESLKVQRLVFVKHVLMSRNCVEYLGDRAD